MSAHPPIATTSASGKKSGGDRRVGVQRFASLSQFIDLFITESPSHFNRFFCGHLNRRNLIHLQPVLTSAPAAGWCLQREQALALPLLLPRAR
jgi:hypothetical protein